MGSDTQPAYLTERYYFEKYKLKRCTALEQKPIFASLQSSISMSTVSNTRVKSMAQTVSKKSGRAMRTAKSLYN